MEKLSIYTLLNSQYRVFDLEGQLPFDVVFGLCRRSSEDLDPRPLVLDTRGSALDVPYAIANGLLDLLVDGKRMEIISNFDAVPEKKGTFVPLPSPVGRSKSWRTGIVAFHCRINSDSKLAALFGVGREYEIRFTGEDLGVQRCYYGQPEMDQQSTSKLETQEAKLVIQPKHGRCRFEVVPALLRPPSLTTTLALGSPNGNETQAVPLHISVTNTSATTVSVQTFGAQRFLVPRGPMFEEERFEARPRIIDEKHPGVSVTVTVTDAATNAIVRSPPEIGPSGPGDGDQRPKTEWMVTLKPGVELTRVVDVGGRVEGLPDGRYNLRLESRKLWWFEGACEDLDDERDGKVSKRVCTKRRLPAVLAFERVVTFRVGKSSLIILVRSCESHGTDNLHDLCFRAGSSTTYSLCQVCVQL